MNDLTDKEILEALDFQGNYEAYVRIIELKREVKRLKTKLTKCERFQYGRG